MICACELLLIMLQNYSACATRRFTVHEGARRACRIHIIMAYDSPFCCDGVSTDMAWGCAAVHSGANNTGSAARTGRKSLHRCSCAGFVVSNLFVC